MNDSIASEWTCKFCNKVVAGGEFHICADGRNLYIDSGKALSVKLSVIAADYENASWNYVFVSMLAYAFQPIALPLMILLSKILKRKIEWFTTNK